MRLLKLILTGLLSITPLLNVLTQEQEESYLEVIGLIDHQNKALVYANVAVYKGNTKVKTLKTGNDGEFRVQLEMNNEYIIEVNKPGMITKKIKFDTKVPEGTTGKWTAEFSMGMYKGCEGVVSTVYNEPVDIITYNKRSNGFVSDKNYLDKRMPEIQDFMMALDECHAKELQDLIDKADDLFREGNYEEARKYYEEALAIFPGDRYPKRRLDEITQKLNKEEENAAKYAEAVAEADMLLANGDIEAAKSKYMAALKYKPQENYAREKVAEIDKQIAAKQANDQARRAMQLQYQNIMDRAAAAYAAKNYEEAKKLYQEAMKLMPDETLAQQKVAELEPLIIQKQQVLQQKQAQQKVYQEAISMGDKAMLAQDFALAKEHYQRAITINPTNPYPKQKIDQIDNLIAQKELQEQQALRAQQEAEYNKVINQADMYFDQKKFEEAKSAYQQALQIKPSDPYASQKINTVNNLIIALAAQQQAELERNFNESLSKGDAYKLDKEYALALQYYNQAKEIKPDNALVQSKIEEAQRLLNEQKKLLADKRAQQERYNEIISKANGLYTAQNLTEAKTLYQEASSILPNESLPKNRIAEIDKRLNEQQKQTQYDQIIAEADQLYAQKSYEMSKTSYQRALTILPSESYPQQRIDELNRLIAEANQQAAQKRQQYEQHIQLADNYFRGNNYSAAKTEYEKALALIPNEPYSTNQLSRVNNLLAEQQRREAEKKQQYDQIIAEADQLYAQKSYEMSRASYQKALAILPSESYPQQRIDELNRLIVEANQQAAQKRQQYEQHIQLADNYFRGNNYNEAKTEYEKALALMPNEPYPTNQLSRVNNLLAEQQQREAEKKQQYNQLVARADNLLGQEQYEQAKSNYRQALLILPQEVYPKQKITEIDKILDERSRLLAMQQQKKLQYDNIITQADNLFNTDRLAEARASYLQAQSILPSETYPQTQITKIDNLLAEKQRREKEETEREHQYQQYIVQADQQFNNGNYDQAKTLYQSALNLKPDEIYPKNRLAESDRLLANIGQQKEYQNIIRTADEYFEQKNYSQARTEYQRAGNLMPDESYPKTKIAEINRIVAENARIEAEQQRIEQEYKQAIVLADRYFGEKNYTLAKTQYQKAKSIKPTEEYPQTQISEINNLLAIQQQAEEEQRKKDQFYAQSISQADDAFRSNNLTQAKTLYTQALGIKPDEIHPKQQIDKINNMLTQQEAEHQEQQALEKQYKDIIASADQAYNINSLKNAREYYLQALKLKPGESYPRSQIRKIEEKERLLAQQEAMRKSSVTASTSDNKEKSKLQDLNFKSESEREKYFAELKRKYSEGVTLETHKEGNKTTRRFIIIRNNEVNEFREVRFSWGGAEYTLNGKPINSQYFRTQVRVREGESYQEFNF